MERRGCCSATFAAVFTLIQGCAWAALAIAGLLLYECQIPISEIEAFRLIYVTYFYNRHCNDPFIPSYIADWDWNWPHGDIKPSEKARVLVLIYLVVSLLWAITAGILFVGAKKFKPVLYLPWIFVTAVLLLLDVVATIVFCLDLEKTTTFKGLMELLGVEKTFPYVPAKAEGLSFLPTVVMVLFSARCVILWVVNALLLRAAVNEAKAVHRENSIFVSSPRTQDTAEKNVRNHNNAPWQEHHNKGFVPDSNNLGENSRDTRDDVNRHNELTNRNDRDRMVESKRDETNNRVDHIRGLNSTAWSDPMKNRREDHRIREETQREVDNARRYNQSRWEESRNQNGYSVPCDTNKYENANKHNYMNLPGKRSNYDERNRLDYNTPIERSSYGERNRHDYNTPGERSSYDERNKQGYNTPGERSSYDERKKQDYNSPGERSNYDERNKQGYNTPSERSNYDERKKQDYNSPGERSSYDERKKEGYNTPGERSNYDERNKQGYNTPSERNNYDERNKQGYNTPIERRNYDERKKQDYNSPGERSNYDERNKQDYNTPGERSSYDERKKQDYNSPGERSSYDERKKEGYNTPGERSNYDERNKQGYNTPSERNNYDERNKQGYNTPIERRNYDERKKQDYNTPGERNNYGQRNKQNYNSAGERSSYEERDKQVNSIGEPGIYAEVNKRRNNKRGRDDPMRQSEPNKTDNPKKRDDNGKRRDPDHLNRRDDFKKKVIPVRVPDMYSEPYDTEPRNKSSSLLMDDEAVRRGPGSKPAKGLQNQYPWSYLNPQDNSFLALKKKPIKVDEDAVEEEEQDATELPPVPVPDYTLHFGRPQERPAIPR